MTFTLERTLAHGVWATAQWWDRLDDPLLSPEARQGALAELAHMVCAEEVWLSRIQGEALPVSGSIEEASTFWPGWDLDEARQRHSQVSAVLLGLARRPDAEVSYTDTAGVAHRTMLEDILLHVSIHGQFHRGRASERLRAAGQIAPVGDYIQFVRAGGGQTPDAESRERQDQATWGRGTLDNQAAETWLEQFVAAPSDGKIAAAFADASVGSSADDEARAVAAAEVVAARAGRGKPGLPPRLLAWSLGHSAALEPDLVRAALKALIRIEREGALANYWKDEEELVPWRRGLEALRERLGG